jgi:hypothetical protein
MACRCPLVVSDIPEHRAFLTDDSALFVRPEDPDSIAAAILEALSDPAAGLARAQRARELIEKFSLGRLAYLYDEVYRDVLARAAGRPAVFPQPESSGIRTSPETIEAASPLPPRGAKHPDSHGTMQ